MEPIKATLRFMGYDVQIMNFQKKIPQQMEENSEIELNPIFSRHISSKDKTHYELALGVKLEQDNLPFYAEIVLVGKFAVDEEQNAEKIMKVNATAVLFPYVRATLSMLTTLAEIPPINIPPINLVKMFEHEQSESENEA